MKLKRIAALVLSVFMTVSVLCLNTYADDSGAQDLPDYISLDFTMYQDGIVNRTDSADLEIVVIDGRNALKVSPKPECTEVTTLSIDGYSYSGAAIDLEYYTWVAVEYFYASDAPITAKGTVTIYPNGNVITAPVQAEASDYVKANEWTCALFDISKAKTVLNPETDNHYMRQMHIRPFGIGTLSKLSYDEPLYISRVIFFKEKPSFDYRNPYFEGYGDGTFRPSELLTRAEACALVARLIENDSLITGTPTFKDADASEWYARYVGFLEEKGMLKFFGTALEPDSYITQGDFARLCTMAVSLTAAGRLPAADTGGAVPSEKETGYVSRAQAAAMINISRGSYANPDVIENEIQMLFLDVDSSSTYFSDIAQAAVAHTVQDGEWLFALQDPVVMLAEKIGYEALYNTAAGEAKVAELDELEKSRISEIRSLSNDIPAVSGRIIYVSSSMGDDSYDGFSTESPKKTLAAANAIAKSGDAVLLFRGDLWREKMTAVEGVTYSACGYGDKPKIYGSPENGALASKWTLVYENAETGALIWKYDRTDLPDVGTMVFDGGEGYAMKEIPSCVGADFVLRSDSSVPYDYTVELDNNLEFFHAANSVLTDGVNGPYISIGNSRGPLYLRCDNGNPGRVFSSIEFNTRGNVIAAKNNVTIDNLCIMYGGSHGIGTGNVKNLTVTNCEIGWIGGSIQSYNANGQTNNSATRFGNGVEVYGSCDGYTIDNCYVYQCYDAGVTHQYSSLSVGDCVMKNVTYSNNVITECVYSIEYFLGTATGYTRYGDNIVFEDNLLRRAGYGFGSFRPDGRNQRHIRSSSRDNPFTNYVVSGNVFDRSVHQLIYANTPYKECMPVMDGNIYIQGIGNNFYHYGSGKTASTDYNAKKNIRNVLGDENGKMYFVDPIPYYEYTYVPPRSFSVVDSDRY